MKTHSLKIESKYLDRIIDGSKLFEIRKNDRDFQAGDEIIFKEVEKIPHQPYWKYAAPTRTELAKITYILSFSEGLRDGYVGFGIKLISGE